MTAAQSPAPDDPLNALLAAYDVALAAGQLPELAGETTLAPEQRSHLERLRACLCRLERHRQTSEMENQPPGRTATETEIGLPSFGQFRLLRELGRGGCGIVYLAEDLHLHRQVALKIPRPEALLSPSVRRRFVREGLAAALLDHPSIVPIYEAGEQGAICYIASAYCPGPSLAAWLRSCRKPVDVREAAQLIAQLADAVAYMHQRGILHRDLKPANILLQKGESGGSEDESLEADASLGLPLSAFLPRITDFGLARSLEGDSNETETGVPLGTALYMSPEQATGRRDAVGPPADVYALGVILYETLTGRPPFRGETALETLQQLGAAEPPSLRRLRPDIPRDLAAICEVCLARAPAKRYATAAALAEDLRRFLDGRPTAARPLHPWQHGLRWVRRRPATAMLLSVLALVLLSFLLAGLWHYRQLGLSNDALQASLDRERASARQAEQQAERSRRLAYGGSIRLAHEFWKARRFEFLRDPLNQERPEPGQLDLRGFEWHYLWRQSEQHAVFRGHRHVVTAVALSPDGTLCASGSADKDVLLWETTTGRLLARWSGHNNCVHGLSFTRDGKLVLSLALADADAPSLGPEAKLWEVATGHAVAGRSWPGERSGGACAVAPDGQTVAWSVVNETPARVGVRIWNAITGEDRLLKELVPPASVVTGLCFTPDSRSLAIASYFPIVPSHSVMIRFLDLQTLGAKTILQEVPNSIIRGLAFSADGNSLASADQAGHIRLWNLPTSTVQSMTHFNVHCTPQVSFSPDGKTLAIGIDTLDRSKAIDFLTFWDTASRKRGATINFFGCGISPLTFTPDSKTVVYGATDHLVHSRRLEPEPEFVAVPGHQPREAWSVAFNPVDGTLASAGDDHAIKLWDAATGRHLATWQGHKELVTSLAFSPDGAWLASGSFDGTARLWHAASGRVQAICTGHTDRLRVVAFSPDSQVLATGAKNGTVKLWEVATGKEVATLRDLHGIVRALVFTPDGRTLAASGEDDSVLLWDLETRQVRHSFKVAQRAYALALSPDGRVLAAGQKSGLITSWRLDTGEEAGTYLGHTEEVRSLAFSPDGRTLVSGGADRTVRLWSAATGTELLVFPRQPHAVNSLAFSADGQSLAAALHDGTLRLWHAGAGGEHEIGQVPVP